MSSSLPSCSLLEVHLLGFEQPPHPEDEEAVAPAAVPFAAAAAVGRVRHGQHRTSLCPSGKGPC